VRILARLGRAARESVKIRVRQPLGVLQAVVPDPSLLTDELLDVLRDELNVKRVQFLQGAAGLVSLRAQPNFRQLGRRFGGRTQEAAASIRALDAPALRAFTAGEPVTIDVGGEIFPLEPGDADVVEEATGDLVVESDEGCTIALDPAIDEPLRLEGLARELVNRIQRIRKDTGLSVSDRIRLGIYGGPDIVRAAEQHADYIAAETLAVGLESGVEPAGAEAPGVHETELDGVAVRIGVSRA
jgi:isoleucyl-tRNA synthetase